MGLLGLRGGVGCGLWLFLGRRLWLENVLRISEADCFRHHLQVEVISAKRLICGRRQIRTASLHLRRCGMVSRMMIANQSSCGNTLPGRRLTRNHLPCTTFVWLCCHSVRPAIQVVLTKGEESRLYTWLLYREACETDQN